MPTPNDNKPILNPIQQRQAREESAEHKAAAPIKPALANLPTSASAAKDVALGTLAQELQDLAVDLRSKAPGISAKLEQLSNLAADAFDPKRDVRRPSETKGAYQQKVKRFVPVRDAGKPYVPAQRVHTQQPVEDPKA